MQHLVARTRSRVRPRLGLTLALAVLAVALVFLVRPHRWFGRPDLQLVALDANGLFRDMVELPRAWADTTFRGAYGATARVALVLAVRNVGEVEASALSLSLSLPARYRLETNDGRELPHETTPGNPLIRYTIKGPFPPVQPGRLPTMLTAADTLWLEPVVPQLYCVAVGDSVPEFIPAATPDPRLLSHVQIFYSFDGSVRHGRQAGLLSLQLDPSIVERPATPPPPVYATAIRQPAWPMPPLGDLHRVAAVSARCGPPEAPLELASTIWQGAAGGRVFVLSYGGKPRKYLFDLNSDGTVDLEMWDAAGRGYFDAQRAARYPIPAFLLPPAGPAPFNPAVFAELSPDSLARLRIFTQAGPYEPLGSAETQPGGPFRTAGVYLRRGPAPAPRPPGIVAGSAGAGTTPQAGTMPPVQSAAAVPAPAPAPAPAESASRPRNARRSVHLLGRPVRLPNLPRPRPRH